MQLDAVYIIPLKILITVQRYATGRSLFYYTAKKY
jgi:hypothetical protein